MLSSNRKTRSKGRLVRSLEFEPSVSTTVKPRKKSSPIKSIWRKNVIDPVGFTTHKMSSVTNNFLSSDVNLEDSSSSSSIDEMVGDLVDPGRATLVFPQHDEVFRTSPLSNSSFIIENDLDMNLDEPELNNNNNNDNNNDIDENIFVTEQEDTLGMTWNPKQNQWLPLIYRYVFPSSAFSLPRKSITSTLTTSTSQKQPIAWTLKNGQVHLTSTVSEKRSATFTFPPPQKSIMMGPHCDDKDARDVCEKLLELMDDENLMLPAVKVSPQCSSPVNTVANGSGKNNPPCNTTNSHTQAQNQTQTQVNSAPLKSLLSEWSSLPSSPPPPIFHDVLCNRPIPELRLSPPMTGKCIGKRPAPTTTSTTAVTNSPCESPLTKRLRFSSSSSSIA